MNNAAYRLSNGDILIVEDNRADLKYLIDILTKAGHRVRPASDSELALRSVCAKPPELILLDVNLPGINGIDLCRRFKADNETANIPVIFISAIGETELKVKAFESGGIDYITKPFEPSEILARINTYLSIHRLQRTLSEQTEKLISEIRERKWASEELARHRAHLEALIEERTAKLQQEIIEHMQTAEALRDQRWRLESIIEGTHIGTWEWNIQTGETVFNEIWAEIVGYTLEELSPTTIDTWTALAHPDDLKQSNELLALHLAGELSYYECECRMRHKDGHWVWVRDCGRIITRMDDGKPLMMFGAHTDITADKQTEEYSFHLQKAESLHRMAGAIAHHFNNQLFAVIGNLELGMEAVPNDTDAFGYLNSAIQAARKSAELSTLMLTYLGLTTRNRETLDLSGVCSQSLPGIQAVLPEAVIMETDLPIPGPTIQADANQIRQILTNLITNAYESIGEGPGTVYLGVKTVLSADIPESQRFPIEWQPQGNAYACLEVRDTGCGISIQDLVKLFDPFFTTKFTGRGLGLPVVKGIVRAHQGVVVVESEPGKGSIFRVFFPLKAE